MNHSCLCAVNCGHVGSGVLELFLRGFLVAPLARSPSITVLCARDVPVLLTESIYPNTVRVLISGVSHKCRNERFS